MGHRVKNRDQRSDASTPDAERRGHGDAASKDQSSEYKSSFVGAAFSRDLNDFYDLNDLKELNGWTKWRNPDPLRIALRIDRP